MISGLYQNPLCLNGVQGVASSNLAVPTIKNYQNLLLFSTFFLEGNVKVQGMCIFFLIMPLAQTWLMRHE